MNLTLQIDDEVLARARMKALKQGTSVNAMVRKYLESYSGDDHDAEVLKRFTERARANAKPLHYGERTWTRDDLHDRDMLPNTDS